jgi:hypothetical protein
MGNDYEEKLRTENEENTKKCNCSNKDYPPLLTEEELIQLLRIPETSKATDFHNVIINLIRFRNLPRIHISKKVLFPLNAIIEWINKETIRE